MANKIIIIHREKDTYSKENIIRILRRVWEDRGYETVPMPIREEKSWGTYLPRLREQDVSWLVTVDMAGFGWSTLLEGCAYNLLPAKQLHLLTEDRGQYDGFLQKEYAINLFFFTDNPDTIQDWESRYPLLPHLELISEPENLGNVVDKVIEYTKTAG